MEKKILLRMESLSTCKNFPTKSYAPMQVYEELQVKYVKIVPIHPG